MRYYTSLLVFCYTINLHAQQNKINYQTSVGTYLSTSGKTTFWQRANQYGIVPLESQLLTLQGSIHQEYDSTTYKRQGRNRFGMNYSEEKIKKFGYGFGLNMVGNVGKKSGFYIPEIYGKVRFGIFEFYGGRRKEMLGLVDTTLTMGSIIWSESALPIPKVQISIPNYVSILGKGIVSIKGAYSHGWFGTQDYVKGYYLHQKWLYGKIGRDIWKVNFYGGINHQVQWGGYSEILRNDKFATNNGYFSDDFFVYKNVVLPISIWNFPPNNKYTPYETLNRFGNHLGSLDMGFTVKNKNFNVEFYRQTPYEDGQLPEVLLSADGNYTLAFEFKKNILIKKVSFGYLDTRRQGGEITKFATAVGKNETHPNEIQNYYNHGQYYDGWSYNDFPIGTPFIANNNDIKQPSKDFILFSSNNSIQVFYLATHGKIRKISYSFQSSYSSNQGIIGIPYNPILKQFSSNLLIKYPLKYKDTALNAGISYDNGKLFGNNLGLNFSILKNW